jgi:hypothetical protein
METYIKELDGARLYVGDAETPVGKAVELIRPLAEFISKKMSVLVVEPLLNGDVLLQGRNSDGKPGLLVVPRKEARQCMGIANSLCEKGAHLPRWVRYAIDSPIRPVVIYWREKSIR